MEGGGGGGNFFLQDARMRGGGHLHNQLVSCGLADNDDVHVPVFSRVESESGEGGSLVERRTSLSLLSCVVSILWAFLQCLKRSRST